jgi:genome maintenance exonuclease 1
MKFKHCEVDLGYDDLKTENAGGRFYVTPSGKKHPSITTVLGILSMQGIQEWRKRVGEKEANRVSRIAAGRGTAVHDILEKYLKNEPIDFSEHKNPLITDSAKSLMPILDEHVNNIHCLEKSLYSDHLGIAGRVDCIAEYKGKLSIIDYKTSAKVKKKEHITGYFMQKAAYAIMFEERTGIPITQLVTIMSVDYHKPLVFIERRDNWTQDLIDTRESYRKLYGK